VKADIAKLPTFLSGNNLFSDVRRIFRVELTDKELKQFDGCAIRPTSRVVRVAPVLSIPTAPRPWGRHD